MESLFPFHKQYVIQSGLLIWMCKKPEMECLLPLENWNLTAKRVFFPMKKWKEIHLLNLLTPKPNKASPWYKWIGRDFCKRLFTSQPSLLSLFAKWQSIFFLIPLKKKIFHTLVKLYALNHKLFFPLSPFWNLCKSDYLSRFSILLSYLENAFSKSYLFFTACQVVIWY